VLRNVEPPGAVSARPESEPREVVHLPLRSPTLAGAIKRHPELCPAAIGDPAGGPVAAPAGPVRVAGEVDPRPLPVMCTMKSTAAAGPHPLVPAVQSPVAEKPANNVGWSMRQRTRGEDEQCAHRREHRDQGPKLDAGESLHCCYSLLIQPPGGLQLLGGELCRIAALATRRSRRARRRSRQPRSALRVPVDFMFSPFDSIRWSKHLRFGRCWTRRAHPHPLLFQPLAGVEVAAAGRCHQRAQLRDARVIFLSRFNFPTGR
jgi:hypothetical protein